MYIIYHHFVHESARVISHFGQTLAPSGLEQLLVADTCVKGNISSVPSSSSRLETWIHKPRLTFFGGSNNDELLLKWYSSNKTAQVVINSGLTLG